MLLTEYMSIALVVYDWLINLDDEIRCFWAFKEGRPRLKAGTVLYALSRYATIFQLILSVWTDIPMSSTVRAVFPPLDLFLIWSLGVCILVAEQAVLLPRAR